MAENRTQPCACRHCPLRVQIGGIFCRTCWQARHEPRCDVQVTHR